MYPKLDKNFMYPRLDRKKFHVSQARPKTKTNKQPKNMYPRLVLNSLHSKEELQISLTLPPEF